MSTNPDVNGALRSWLREDEHESADRVLDVVLSRLDSTPQRRSWWPARRSSEMNRLTIAALAAAAVIVVAVVGYNLLPTSVPFGSRATPPAEPTGMSSPTAAALAAAAPPPRSGSVAGGTYGWRWSQGNLTFAVPAGWTATEDGTVLQKNADTTREVFISNWFPGTVYEVTHVYADACRSENALQPFGRTAAALVAALGDQVSTDAEIAASDLDGTLATRVNLIARPDLDRASCRYGEDGPLQIWADVTENNFFSFAPGYYGFAYVIDVEGKPLIVTGTIGSDASRDDIAELDALVDSFRMEPLAAR